MLTAMSTQDPVPTSHDEAVVHAARGVRAARRTMLGALLPAIAAIAAVEILVRYPRSVVAWAVLVVAVAIAGALMLCANRFLGRIRYWVSTRHAPVVLVAMLVLVGLTVLGVAVIAAVTGDDDIAGVMIGAITIGGVLIVLNVHTKMTNLLVMSAHGVIVRRRPLPWSSVAAIVVTDHPDTVEIGIRATPTAMLSALPVRPEESLTDLPMRVMVPREKFDLDRVNWAVNQSGRTDVPILRRTVAGESVLRMSNHRPVPGGVPQQP